MAFIFPANGKNSTSAVCCLAFVRRNEYVCVCRELVISSLFSGGFILEFDKKGTNGKAHSRCRITSCLISLLTYLTCQRRI